MKKFLFLVSIFALTGCFLFPENVDNGVEANAEATEQAKRDITNFTDQEIDRANREFDSKVTSIISKADSALIEKFELLKSSQNSKAEETKNELNSKISEIETRIQKAEDIGFWGIVIGVVGLIVAVIACVKRPKTDNEKVQDIIADAVKNNPNVKEYIRRIYVFSPDSKPQVNVEREIESYIKSRRFKDYIWSINTNNPTVSGANSNTAAYGSSTKTVVPSASPIGIYQLFARDSRTKKLSNVQDCYQRGMSIYKLTLDENNASEAEISICIDRNEVKQRILKYDTQLLEPICQVERLSNNPTSVFIVSPGRARRVDDEWEVTSPIKVEIR